MPVAPSDAPDLAELFAAPQPVLRTGRCVLRPFDPADAADLQRLVDDREIAATTVSIPHPYGLDHAESWIAERPALWTAGKELRAAITDRESGELLGSAALKLDLEHHKAEIGYWVGQPHWGRGIASEVTVELVRYAFQGLGLHRVFAFCLVGNGASSRVLEKAGLRHEGTQRDDICKWGEFSDVEMYGLLRTDLEDRD